MGCFTDHKVVLEFTSEEAAQTYYDWTQTQKTEDGHYRTAPRDYDPDYEPELYLDGLLDQMSSGADRVMREDFDEYHSHVCHEDDPEDEDQYLEIKRDGHVVTLKSCGYGTINSHFYAVAHCIVVAQERVTPLKDLEGDELQEEYELLDTDFEYCDSPVAVIKEMVESLQGQDHNEFLKLDFQQDEEAHLAWDDKTGRSLYGLAKCLMTL